MDATVTPFEYQTLLVDVRLPDAVQLHVGLQLLAEVQPGVAANDTSEVDQVTTLIFNNTHTRSLQLVADLARLVVSRAATSINTSGRFLAVSRDFSAASVLWTSRRKPRNGDETIPVLKSSTGFTHAPKID